MDISLYLRVKLSNDTLGTGTLIDIAFIFPSKSGITTPKALSAPVDDGMIFCKPPRPSRHFCTQF